ncbi:SIS domain-containing protein [Pontibacillus yanchengensis]|uniref:SIS domain-containing protein n=2 Tax=Pontibacillus yanchengensis TaxID=462910 RepID=A0ACC7VEL5_9BACI|nr:MurR/RpiR family transcriptional regulator [Pontibacillus yanchengensis]MYL32046.1 SIS domain-containing protein [Pontibacillus yanchengensis]MYL52624.1 SIS domain-containing protein [Pontibacillus yanchengensis]
MEENASKHVLHRIQTIYSQFSEKEKLIADYILKDPQHIIHSTINQVSEDLMVADATVFRFCKRLGFKGYQAMKIALASEIVNPIQDIHETISEEDSEIDITYKVFNANINALEQSKEIQDQSMMKEIIEVLSNARSLNFFGSGGSGIVAEDAQHKFIRTGIPAHAYSESHLQVMVASQLTKDDIAILISHSGSNKDIIDVLDIVKQNGVPTIAITNLAKSVLSKNVDYALYTAAKETEYRSEALASRIAELTIIDALYVNYCIKHKEQTQEATQKMREAISMKRI